MWRLWGGILALAFVITGCSRAEPGAPVAGPTRAPSSDPSSGAEATATAAATSRSAVAGYPFALLRPSDPAVCSGVVDVHDNQLLYLSVSTGVGEPPAPQDTMCALLPKLAGAAVGVLRR